MKKKKILIADDERELVKGLKIMLESRGYETADAFDGEECLAKAFGEKPDLILLDIMMPKVDGFAVCQRLKSDGATRQIPIIILTAGQFRHSAEEATQAGAHSYLAKPFSLESLLAVVEQVLVEPQATPPDE